MNIFSELSNYTKITFLALDYFVAVSQQEEPAPIVEDDEAEKELQMALERSRRSKVKKETEADEDGRIEKVQTVFHSKELFKNFQCVHFSPSFLFLGIKIPSFPSMPVLIQDYLRQNFKIIL